ncbi:hypothetical protein ABZO31_00690 [Streptomyces sp. HUAS MG47]|uniref:hypothetical protein n=1 Tax=Streptomyces solicamelliae TaxID=3231716 RepID=UPI0038782988
MRTAIDDLAEEAGRLIRHGAWVPTPHDGAVAQETAADLQAAIGAAQSQEMLPAIDRLAHLREAIAAVAIALAHVHGRLAWFLGAAATILTPILHWRALPAEDNSTFGAVTPEPQQYTEAEDAIRRLQSVLSGITVA